MRITNSIIMRGYNRDLKRVGNLRNETMHRITTTRQFNRASEAPLSAAKALNVRKSLYFSAQYKENLSVADSFYTEAETSLLQTSEKLATIRETIIAACNTTKSIDEYNIYAQQLENHAKELCSVLNTDTAGRAIFGGESDDGMPFTIEEDASGNAATVLYHGVPVNAMSDAKSFPFSNDVLADIGLGISVDQQTQEIDPQSALRISFNGAEITGCGAERGVADIDLTSFTPGKKYCLDIYADNEKQTIEFTASKETDQDAANAENIANIQRALDWAYRKSDSIPKIDEQGVISLDNGGIVCALNNPNAERTGKLNIDNDSGYTKKYRLDAESLEPGKEYKVDVTIGEETRTVVFAAGENADPDKAEEASLYNLQNALTEAFKDTKYKPQVSMTEATKGIITCEGASVKVLTGDGEKTVDNSFIGSGNVIDASNLEADKVYTFAVSIGSEYEKFSYQATGDKDADQTAIEDLIISSDLAKKVDLTITDGKVTVDKPTYSAANETGETTPLTGDGKLDMDNLTNAKYKIDVTVGTDKKTIEFQAVAGDPDKTIENLNNALKKEYFDTAYDVKYDDTNGITATARTLSVYSTTLTDGEAEGDSPFEMDTMYSNNYIQLTLDAAKALRNGDIEYANGCIDRIVSAGEKLLIEIANLGCNEDFISFNIDRITTREYNLDERQNKLETADLEEQSTLMKTYSALYNACLQMASEVVPNSIFNYMS